jgi:hypothetical protein
MDINKAIRFLKVELRDLDRVIDAIELAVAAHIENRGQEAGIGESPMMPPENRNPAHGVWLH